MKRMILGTFRKNPRTKPKVNVDDVFESREHGEYKVVAYASQGGITVEFKNTGNRYFVTTQQIKNQTVRDEKLCQK